MYLKMYLLLLTQTYSPHQLCGLGCRRYGFAEKIHCPLLAAVLIKLA